MDKNDGMTSAQSDMELLMRVCKQDDRHAFKILFDRYWEKLFLLASRKLDSDSDASDIVQNIFIRLWERRQLLNINRTVEGYLFISLKNSILNYYKLRITQKRHLSAFYALHGCQEETGSPRIMANELHIQIDKEIRQLPEKMREVFMLSRNDHLSAKQIAEKLSISEQTVRNQISDAIHRIRVCIRQGF